MTSRPGASLLFSFSCSVFFVFGSSVLGAWLLAEGLCLITAHGRSPSVIVQTGPSRSTPTERKQARHKVTFQTKSNKCFIDRKTNNNKQAYVQLNKGKVHLWQGQRGGKGHRAEGACVAERHIDPIVEVKKNKSLRA